MKSDATARTLNFHSRLTKAFIKPFANNISVKTGQYTCSLAFFKGAGGNCKKVNKRSDYILTSLFTDKHLGTRFWVATITLYVTSS